MRNILKMFGSTTVITLILASLLVPCVPAQMHGSEEKINLPSDLIDIGEGNKKYAALIACLIESREHVDDTSSEFSIYNSDTSDNFNKKLNEYQEKLKGYQKQVGEIAIGQIVPDPKGSALNTLTHGVAGEISGIKTMADLSSILLSISQDTVDLYKEACKGGTTQARVAEVKQGIGKGYNGMIIQTASDAIQFNEIMGSSSFYMNTYRDTIREVETIPKTEKDVEFEVKTQSSYTIKGRHYYIKDLYVVGNRPPILLFKDYHNYPASAIYGFRDLPGRRPLRFKTEDEEPGYIEHLATQYRIKHGEISSEDVERGSHTVIYYPNLYRYFTEDDIKSYYEEHGFEVPEEYKVVEISVTPQQIQSLQDIKSYTPKIPDYSTSDLYKYLDNLTDRWGIEAQILKEYPVSSDGRKALDEYKSDVEYLPNLAFYSQLFVIKGDHVLTVKPNEPVIKSLINLGDFKDHVNYFENRIERNGQIAKEEYAKPFKNKATEWNTEIKELEDKSKLAKSKLQKGKPSILGMIFGDESYDAATAKFNEAQRRINEAKKDIKEIEKSLQSNEIQFEKVNTVEASLNSAEKDLNEIDTHLKKSGEASALYKIARSYTRYIKRIG